MYGTYIRRMHEVISGEFGKIFVHCTWVTNDWEQHSVPSVYRDVHTGCAVSRASPASMTKAAAQRVPLPGISASPPSGLNRRIAQSHAVSPFSAGETRSQPSAPAPVWRSQMATAARVRPSRGPGAPK